MHKVLLATILIFSFLNASQKNIMSNINKTYSNNFYDKSSLNVNLISIDNYESNNTQKKIKEDFENLMPAYLKQTELFSPRSLKYLKKNKIKKYMFLTFIKSSLIYIKQLEQSNKTELSRKIMKRNLINSNALMTNSNNLIDYIIALTAYSKLITYCSNPSQDMILVFRNFPPPNESIYFEKVEFEKIILFNLIDNMNNVDEKSMENYSNSDLKKLMTQVQLSAKQQLEIYFSKMAVATKSKSKIKQLEFKKYMKEEKDNLFSLWTKIKLLMHTMLAKLFHIFVGYNYQFNYMANYIGKILAITTVPNISTVYNEHIKMKGQYQKIFKEETKN